MSNSQPFEHAACALETTYGQSQLHCFSYGEHEEDNLLVIDCLDRVPYGASPLVRVQSACYTAEIFRSTDCDCHGQLTQSLSRIHSEGGALVYMICDGRGAGLLAKVKGLALGDSEGLDTHDAYVRLGVPTDPRQYSRVAEILAHLGLDELRLMTNNPRKTQGLRDHGLSVSDERLIIAATSGSASYLATKRDKMGHLLA